MTGFDRIVVLDGPRKRIVQVTVADVEATHVYAVIISKTMGDGSLTPRCLRHALREFDVDPCLGRLVAQLSSVRSNSPKEESCLNK